jgi:hypothetical protein
MTESEHQDARTIAFAESDLTQRMLRRATEPIGVIDTRHAIELHSRASILQGQRLALLDNFRGRYGLDSAGTASTAPASDMSLIAPRQRLADSDQLNLRSSASLVSHAGIPQSTMGSAQKSPPVSSEPQYRVVRPERQVGRNPPRPLSPGTVASRSPVTGEIRVSAISPSAMHLQRKTDRTPSPVDSRTAPSTSSLVRAAPADTAGHRHNKFAPERYGSLIAETLPRVGELPRIATVAPLRLKRRPDGLAADENGSLSTPNNFRLSPTQDGFTRDNGPTSSTPSTGDTPVIFPLIIEETARSARHASQSSGGAQPPRKPDPQRTLPSTNAAQQVEAVRAPPPANPNSQSHRAVTAEIRAAPLLPDSKNIVWRKANAYGASGLTVGPTGTRGFEITREAASASVIYRDESLERTSESNGVDVPRIAEQVTRRIARQLRIERERRGLT